MRNDVRLIFLILLLASLSVQAQQSYKRSIVDAGQSRTLPGDTIAVRILLAELRQAIQLQKSRDVVRNIASRFDNDGSIETRDQLKTNLDNYFAAAQSREISLPRENFTTTWDFDIVETDFRLAVDSAAVDCHLIFHSGRRKTSETLKFIKHNESAWKLAGWREMMMFLNSALPRKALEIRKEGHHE